MLDNPKSDRNTTNTNLKKLVYRIIYVLEFDELIKNYPLYVIYVNVYTKWRNESRPFKIYA